MRFWVIVSFFAALLGFDAGAQTKPFLNTIQLRTTETYTEALRVAYPEEPASPYVDPYTFTINIVASIDPLEAALFDEDTIVSLQVGNFTIDEVTLGQDENFDSTVAGKNRSATFAFESFDYDSNQFIFGRAVFSWSGLNVLTVGVTFTNAGKHYFEAKFPPEYWLWAYDSQVDNAPNPDISEFSIARFRFGNYSTPPEGITYYIFGDSSVTGADELVKVNLKGANDDIAPTVRIATPAAGAVVNASPLAITGSVRDFTYLDGANGVNNQFAPTVQVFLSDKKTLPESPAWISAIVAESSDTQGFREWHTPSAVALNPGPNYIFVRATDDEGNVSTLGPQLFVYSTKGQISLTGAATGFPSGTDGSVVGNVIAGGSAFPNPKKVLVKVNSSPTPESDTRTNIEAGTVATATAHPEAGAIFNGWTATVEGAPFALDPEEAVKEKMTFLTRPKLVIIGNFVPNPFLSAGVGAYFGLGSGNTGADRGIFIGKVGKDGAFSGKFKLGTLTLPVKGKFLGSGHWTGIVTKKGQTYAVTLDVTVTAGSAQAITGTVSGGGVSSSITADLTAWKKKLVESTAYEGAYNVVLPTNATSPIGVGYGQVKIAKLGKVKFVGKAGDGTPISFSSVLFKRSVTDVGFPFFAAVEKKTGSISGSVYYDPSQPNTDLTGTLDWWKPLTLKIEPNPIDAEIALSGSRYTKPASGARVILGTNGLAQVTISAPAFSSPTVAGSAFLSSNATLATTNSLLLPINSSTVELKGFKFSTSTGLFSGKFFDPALRKTISFSGAATQKDNAGAGSAGGVFVRGNKSGFVTLSPGI